jgi:hypothetical protein
MDNMGESSNLFIIIKHPPLLNDDSYTLEHVILAWPRLLYSLLIRTAAIYTAM